jgi:hypothetical protein
MAGHRFNVIGSIANRWEFMLLSTHVTLSELNFGSAGELQDCHRCQSIKIATTTSLDHKRHGRKLTH